MACADGFVAIGQWAKGFLAIGQFVSGYFSIGQFVTARVAGIGQFVAAPLAIGQFAVAVAAIGQIGVVGTGIFQSAIMFFGGTGQKIWGHWQLLANDSGVIVETYVASGSRDASTLVFFRARSSMQNELASNKNVGAAHLGSLLGTWLVIFPSFIALHFMVCFPIGL